MPDGNTTVIIQGKKRFKISEVTSETPYMVANIQNVPEISPSNSTEFPAIIESIKELALRIIEESPTIPSEASIAIKNIKSSKIKDLMVSMLFRQISLKNKNSLGEMNMKKRVLMVLEHLTLEVQMLEMKNEIQSKVRTDLDQQQREYFLNQQMKAIQEELGGVSYEEIEEMRNQASKKKWSSKIKEAFSKELKKLERMNPSMLKI